MAIECYPTAATKLVSDIVKVLPEFGLETLIFTSQHDFFGKRRYGSFLGKERVYFTPSILIRLIYDYPYIVCPLAFHDLVKMVWKENVDVLHAHVFPMSIIANISAFVKMATKVPLVVTFHGLHFEGYTNPLYRDSMHAYYKSYFRFLCSQADFITVLGSKSAENAKKFGADESKIVIIPNGTFVESFHPRPSSLNDKDTINVTYIGRMDYSKGVFTLLKAAVVTRKKYGDKVQFLFVGGGPYLKLLEKTIETINGLRDNVKLVGHVQDVKKILVHSDIFVLPSYYEGMPLSLLEAMACAKPVIATNVGDVSDVVKDGFNGLLVEPGSPLALANAIEKLLDDSQFAKKLGIRGYETVKESFGIEVVCRKLKTIYEKACVL